MTPEFLKSISLNLAAISWLLALPAMASFSSSCWMVPSPFLSKKTNASTTTSTAWTKVGCCSFVALNSTPLRRCSMVSATMNSLKVICLSESKSARLKICSILSSEKLNPNFWVAAFISDSSMELLLSSSMALKTSLQSENPASILGNFIRIVLKFLRLPRLAAPFALTASLSCSSRLLIFFECLPPIFTDVIDGKKGFESWRL
mmetsp:Transcript_1940/g.2172  ORF Transcript_1940/g.2172 Transcript_1940/m.2172 type:complete len:204 (+) Transcript_1940:617-1228(+)